MKTYVEYEVFADAVCASDIITCDTLEEAEKEAEKWSNETNCDVIIVKIEKTILSSWNKGAKNGN